MLRIRRKLAAVNRDNQVERPWYQMSRDTVAPKIDEEYITQVSEEMENKAIKKVPPDFSGTDSRIRGALSNIYDFILNSQFLVQHGSIPGTSRDTIRENQEINENRSQNDPHREVDRREEGSSHTLIAGLHAVLHNLW